MPDLSRKKKKRPRDLNLLSQSIVKDAVGETEPTTKQEPTKNPAAVALGRLGGLKGGKSRAKKLSKAQRVEIARKAAKARWQKSRLSSL